MLPKGKWGYFFVNYQGTRQRSGLSSGTIIGTSLPVLPVDRSAASLANAFFGSPAYRWRHRSGCAEAAQLAEQPVWIESRRISDSEPAGTPGGDTARFNYSRAGKYNDDQFTANYDKEIGPKDKLAVRFFFSNFESVLPFGAGGLQASFGGSISPTDLNFPYDLPVRDRFPEPDRDPHLLPSMGE